MKLLIFVLLSILLLVCGFLAGYDYHIQVQSTIPLNVQIAIDIIEQARYTHQYYLDNPDKMEETRAFERYYKYYGDYDKAIEASLKHQRESVIRYNYVLNVLRGLYYNGK